MAEIVDKDLRTARQLFPIGAHLKAPEGEFIYIQFIDNDYGWRDSSLKLTNEMKKQLREAVLERWQRTT